MKKKKKKIEPKPRQKRRPKAAARPKARSKGKQAAYYQGFSSQHKGDMKMTETTEARKLFDPAITRRAILDSFRKLAPLHMVRNPVMFTVYVGSLLTSGLWLQALGGKGEAAPGFIFAVSLWLWFTVLF